MAAIPEISTSIRPANVSTWYSMPQGAAQPPSWVGVDLRMLVGRSDHCLRVLEGREVAMLIRFGASLCNYV